jgi:hypothetical protein
VTDINGSSKVTCKVPLPSVHENSRKLSTKTHTKTHETVRTALATQIHPILQLRRMGVSSWMSRNRLSFSPGGLSERAHPSDGSEGFLCRPGTRSRQSWSGHPLVQIERLECGPWSELRGQIPANIVSGKRPIPRKICTRILRSALLHEHSPGLTGASMRIQAGGPSRRMFLRY